MIVYKSDYAGISCKFSPFNNDILACGFSENYGIIGKGKLIVFSYEFNDINRQIEEKCTIDFERCVTSIEFSRINNNIIIVSTNNGFVYLVDLIKSKILTSFQSHQKDILSIASSDNYLITTGVEGIAKIYDIRNNNLIDKIDKIFKGSPVTCAKFHPKNNNILGFTSMNGNCLIFDIRKSLQSPTKCYANRVGLTSLSLSNSLLLLSFSSGLLSLQELISPQNNHSIFFQGHEISCESALFLPDSEENFISCGFDMDIKLWEKGDCRPVGVYRHHKESVMGIDVKKFGNKEKSKNEENGGCLNINGNKNDKKVKDNCYKVNKVKYGYLVCSTGFDKTLDIFEI